MRRDRRAGSGRGRRARARGPRPRPPPRTRRWPTSGSGRSRPCHRGCSRSGRRTALRRVHGRRRAAGRRPRSPGRSGRPRAAPARRQPPARTTRGSSGRRPALRRRAGPTAGSSAHPRPTSGRSPAPPRSPSGPGRRGRARGRAAGSRCRHRRPRTGRAADGCCCSWSRRATLPRRSGSGKQVITPAARLAHPIIAAERRHSAGVSTLDEFGAIGGRRQQDVPQSVRRADGSDRCATTIQRLGRTSR